MAIIREIVQRIMSVTSLNQQEVMAKIYYNSNKLFSGLIKRINLNRSITFDWAVKENIDLNWLITGQGAPNGPKNPANDPLLATVMREPEPASNYTARRTLDIPADEMAVAFDIKLQSATALMDNLLSAISRLRQRNDQLVEQNSTLVELVRQKRTDKDLKEVEKLLIVQGGQTQ